MRGPKAETAPLTGVWLVLCIEGDINVVHTCVGETHHKADEVYFRVCEGLADLVPFDGVATHAHVGLAQAFH